MSNLTSICLLLLAFILIVRCNSAGRRFADDITPGLLIYSLEEDDGTITDNDDDDDQRTVMQNIHTKCIRPGMIALTFDDGPAEYTDSLLSVLSAERVKATFFLLGVNLAASGGVQQSQKTLRQGHTLGCHSYSHPDVRSLSTQQVKSELDNTQKQFMRVTGGSKCRYFRFPYGYSDARVEGLVGGQGYEMVGWNLDTNDWKWRNSQTIFQTVKQELQASGGPKTESFIILLHDIIPETVDATKSIIRLIKQLGYRLVTVDECLGE